MCYPANWENNKLEDKGGCYLFCQRRERIKKKSMIWVAHETWSLRFSCSDALSSQSILSPQIANLYTLDFTKYTFGISYEEGIVSFNWQQQLDRVNNSNYRAVSQRCLVPDAGIRADMEQIIDDLNLCNIRFVWLFLTPL